MSLVTSDEDIFFLPVFSSTPTNMISDCTLEWCTKYETALQKNEVKLVRNVYMYINYSLIILPFLTSINTVELSLTLNLFQHKLFPVPIPQRTTQNESETDQMDSFNESDLQLADETFT